MNYKKIFITYVLLLTVFQITGIEIAFSASDVIIVSNKTVNEISLKKNDLRNIFLGDKSVWTNREKINFVILKKGPAHKAFLDSYINKTPKNFIRYWKRQILTGKSAMPKLVETEKEVIDYVTTTEGAIGYVLEGNDIDDLKKLLIKK